MQLVGDDSEVIPAGTVLSVGPISEFRYERFQYIYRRALLQTCDGEGADLEFLFAHSPFDGRDPQAVLAELLTRTDGVERISRQ